ncbi:MAG TPA: hypothetical protein VFF73_38890 [Planctomycetota bacterium]|nr:hypothetical protein [Planctomycetota bacterium]
MDLSMRDLERRAKVDPADGAAVAALARNLLRAGRNGEAKKAVQTRFAAAEIDADTIALALEVGEDLVKGPLPKNPRSNFAYVLRSEKRAPDGLAELAPQIAFAGVPGAGAREALLALRSVFASSIEEERILRVDDERVHEVRFTLARPWIVTRSYAIRSVRLVTIPVAPHAVKLRRQLLKGTSALAFVVDARSEGTSERSSNETAWKALAADCRRANGFAVEDLPLAFVYTDPVEDVWHRMLTVAVGLRRVPRIDAQITTSGPAPEEGRPRFARFQEDDRIRDHDGPVEALSFLLAGVAAAVRGIASPRPRFRR